MADMRDYRKQWMQLQESWKAEDTEVNVSATKKEKLEEGKKKEMPDWLKDKIAKRAEEKAGKSKKDDSKKPVEIEDEAECKEDEECCKEGEKCEVEEAKKRPGPFKNLKFKVGKGAKPMVKDQALKGRFYASAQQEVKEDGAPGGTAGPGVAVANATTSVPGAADPTHGNGPAGVERFNAKIGCKCKPGTKCVCGAKPQERTFPGRTVTGESAGKRMFNHFKQFLEAEGFPGDEIPATTVAPPAPDLGAPNGMEGMEGGMGPEGEEEMPMDILADLQARFPDAKISIKIDAGEIPFDAQTLGKAQNVADTVSGDDELEDLGGDEAMGAEGIPAVPEEEGEINPASLMSAGGSPHEGGRGFGESMALGEEGDETGLEAGLAGAEGGEAESPEAATGGDVGDLGGVMGAEAEGQPVITSDSITLSPEQWEAFLTGPETEVEPTAGMDDGQGESPNTTGEHKSPNPIGF